MELRECGSAGAGRVCGGDKRERQKERERSVQKIERPRVRHTTTLAKEKT